MCSELSPPPIKLTPISITPLAEYEGRVYTQQVDFRYGTQTWPVFDGNMLATVDHVGTTCIVEVLAFLCTVLRNEDHIKTIKNVGDYALELFGEIIDFRAGHNPHSTHSSHDVELILDVGNETLIECQGTYWDNGMVRHQVRLEEIENGRYVSMAPARIDLKSIHRLSDT